MISVSIWRILKLRIVEGHWIADVSEMEVDE
jgi:hypothetical protein